MTKAELQTTANQYMAELDKAFQADDALFRSANNLVRDGNGDDTYDVLVAVDADPGIDTQDIINISHLTAKNLYCLILAVETLVRACVYCIRRNCISKQHKCQ